MTFAAPHSIISGIPYDVIEVGGHPASHLSDFEGDTEMVIAGRGEYHRVCGIGALREGAVRFYEKDVDHEGKDVRVWTVSPESDHFVARHAAAI
jgi:hypothetical protein